MHDRAQKLFVAAAVAFWMAPTAERLAALARAVDELPEDLPDAWAEARRVTGEVVALGQAGTLEPGVVDQLQAAVNNALHVPWDVRDTARADIYG
jgi:hypothetical protein